MYFLLLFLSLAFPYNLALILNLREFIAPPKWVKGHSGGKPQGRESVREEGRAPGKKGRNARDSPRNSLRASCCCCCCCWGRAWVVRSSWRPAVPLAWAVKSERPPLSPVPASSAGICWRHLPPFILVGFLMPINFRLGSLSGLETGSSTWNNPLKMTMIIPSITYIAKHI